MNNEIDVLKQFFAAINRNDLPGITKHFDPQIVRIEPEGFPTQYLSFGKRLDALKWAGIEEQEIR